MVKFARYLGFIGTVFISIVCVAQESTSYDTPNFDIYFTNEVVNQRPSTAAIDEFDCSDRIHVVITAKGLSSKPHELRVRWLDPIGEQKELTRFEFNGLPSTQVWAWLQLHGPTGAILGQMFDPAFGMEEFIGEWHAEVSIDNEIIGKPTFKVLC